MEMTTNSVRISRTAESVSHGHPDKFMDAVADACLDVILDGDHGLANPMLEGCRVAIEGVVKDNQLVLMGEITAREVPDLKQIARRQWEETGYGPGSELAVIEYIARQSPELTRSSRVGGAGDQGIMIGFASNETPEMLPREFALARRVRDAALMCRKNGTLNWVRSDIKTQVTLDGNGMVTSAVIALQHEDREDLIVETEENGVRIKRLSEATRQEVIDKILCPTLSDYFGDIEPEYTVNGAGSFVCGGPRGDAGEVGRKLAVDAYGPRVPVGGGAYSGKDPTKVDRSGAYMARHVAKTIVAREMARECVVTVAYAIGKTKPEMLTAITEDGRDLGDWVRAHFDFAPWAIIDRLGLWRPVGWSYCQTATMGHYGYEHFPWEKV